jgi:carboxypeptidase C (cathepsin A)
MANGQYDLVTTTLATRYIVDHLGIDPRLRDNITAAVYPSGHMMYMHQPSLDKLKGDLTRFYQRALEKKRTSPLSKPR